MYGTVYMHYMWSLSGHHYGNKETMDNVSILRFRVTIIFSGDLQGQLTGGGGDSGWIYY